MRPSVAATLESTPDFNIHDKLKLERKLNLLIYLNEDWSPDFGGELELWDTKMLACEEGSSRFSTSSDLQHGTGQLSRASRPAHLSSGPLPTFDRDLLL